MHLLWLINKLPASTLMALCDHNALLTERYIMPNIPATGMHLDLPMNMSETKLIAVLSNRKII
jgi:hypothetical protein